MLRGPLSRGLPLAVIVLVVFALAFKSPYFLPQSDSSSWPADSAGHIGAHPGGGEGMSEDTHHHYEDGTSGKTPVTGGRHTGHGGGQQQSYTPYTPTRPTDGGEHDRMLLTRIVAHAPGYTVFENLYWRNGTYFIVTDEPWHIPPVSLLGYRSTRGDHHQYEAAFKILAVRGPPVGHVDESKQLGESISLANATRFTSSAYELPSPMLLNNDDQFISHYYHWIGETFLGAWRIWNNYAWARGINELPDFKTIAFPKVHNLEKAKELDEKEYIWEDHAGANRFFMETWFPEARIETSDDWWPRRNSDELYRMPLVVIADRRGGHEGPSATWKPWGDVLRMPVHANWLTQLRDRVLEGYTGDVNLKHGDRPRLVYLSRQDTGRRLLTEEHVKLVAELEKLDTDGVVKYDLLQFVDGTPFPDQLAEFSTADFVVAVHGNGLTHSLWLNPGQGRAVFEIQPRDCSLNDYSPLALAAGVQHFLVRETSMCTPLECPSRGCDKRPDGDTRGPNRIDLTVDAKLVADQIRKMVDEYWNGGDMIPDDSM